MGTELVKAVAMIIYLGSLDGVMASDEKGVAKAVQEKVDPNINKKADGDEDIEMPSGM